MTRNIYIPPATDPGYSVDTAALEKFQQFARETIMNMESTIEDMNLRKRRAEEHFAEVIAALERTK